MARRQQCRHRSPEAVLARSEEALRRTLYIVHQAGPTSFVLREETRERKFKTCLGNPHQCSCSAFRKEGELCVHILWLLLKKFKVPRESSLSFQLGLVEREINDILYGNHTQKQLPEQQPGSTDQSNHFVRRAITSEDICPICQEEFSARQLAIAYCKLGCGQNIHMRCMKIWADHQQTPGDPTVHCPVCRSNFLPLKELCGDDLCVYKPTSVTETGPARVDKPNGGRRRVRERGEVLISRLKAYPVGTGRGGGWEGGKGGVCEMCGEEFKRGDWVRKLPACRHEFHRLCIDGWLRSGHAVCPVDATAVFPPNNKHKAPLKEEKEAERAKDSLTLSGYSIKLPHIEKVVSSGLAIGTVKTIRHRHRTVQDQLQSHDRSHDQQLLPPLHFPFPPSSHPHPTHLTHGSRNTRKKWPPSSALRRGLPSSSSLSLSSARRTLSPQTIGLEVTSLKLSLPPLPPPHTLSPSLHSPRHK